MFPITLRELGREPGVFHVYGEYRGMRYYVASEMTADNAGKRATDYQQRYERARFYVKDRADSTQIDGAWNELNAVYTG